MSNGHPKLERPPISEVVCGMFFENLPLGAMDFGVYWDTRKADFPKREEQPAILEGAQLRLGAAPIRAWLTTKSGERLVQIQSDRFYANWRKRDGNYPRFGDHDGEEGLLTWAIKEFRLFREFCTRDGAAPVLTRLELTKIDALHKGTDYEDIADLKDGLRVARVFDDVAGSPEMQLHLALAENDKAGSTRVLINVGPTMAQIETRYAFPPGENIRDAFASANDRVNAVFFGLFDPTWLSRFHPAEAT